MIEPGKYRHRLTIQRRTFTVDEYGSRKESWALHRKVWAQVEPLSPANMTGVKESLMADSTQSEDFVRVTTHPTDVLPDDRFTYAGKIYNIRAARLNNEQDTMTMFASFLNTHAEL